MSQVTDMTRGNPYKLMLRFALPVIVTNLGQQLYQIVDAAIVGRGVGVDALAAVGCTDWTYWIILWSMSTMTAGFATFVSRYFGKQDYVAMNRSIIVSSVLSALIAIVLTVVGLLAARPVLELLDTPPKILDDAVTYLSTMIAGTLIVTAYNLAAAILRAFGDSKTPLTAMILAAIMNIVLDLLLAIVLGWGVFGAALASVLSQLFSFVFCLVKIQKIEYVKLDSQARQWDWRLCWEILLFGLPLAVQYIIINMGGVLVQSTINVQGSAFIAGYTAVNKLYGLLECSAIALGSAFVTYASQNFGAGEKQRVRRGVNVAIVLAVGAALILMVILLPLRDVLPQLFIDRAELGAADAIGVAAQYLTYMAFGMPILYLVYVHRSNLQAIGNSSWSLVSGIAEAAVRVIIAKCFYPIFGVAALFSIEPLAWLAAWLFVMVPYYFYRKKRL